MIAGDRKLQSSRRGLTALVLVAAACSARAAASALCPAGRANLTAAGSFDYYVLGMQWPASACVLLQADAGIPCQSPRASFVVHGLWPTHHAGNRATCCRARDARDQGNFSLSPIVDLAPQLRHLWPDLTTRGCASDVWGDAWRDYGACSGLSCRGYFRRVLELARRFDFLRALSAKGIFASDRRTHALLDIQEAANSAVGGRRVRLRCQDTPQGHMLYQFHVCLDTDAANVVDCPAKCTSFEGSCCDSSHRLRIPFWSRDMGTSSTADPSSPSTSSETPNGVGAYDPVGYWIGQITGIAAVVGGVGYWIFKTVAARGRSGTSPAEHSYQRIP